MNPVKSISVALLTLLLAGCIPATPSTNQPVTLNDHAPNLVDNDSSTPFVPQQGW
ncbi:MAG TPA: hypothetical protein VGV92_00680 [Gammaproteobacteria bacterium]|nr:hypothetical protein [Gammaproteobacteria bacterium]